MSTVTSNPTLANGTPEVGHTRTVQGSLEYSDREGNWVPAVRHHTVRHLLIQQAAHDGSYTYPRHRGTNATDQTSFLRKDQDYGYDWDNRPPILFQLYPGDQSHSQKPSGLLMFNSRVLLDPYDHPIRDFSELPLTICFSEKGLFIEYYLRLNREIKPYDLMARMGMNSKNKPARISTIVERATKFRHIGLCLSWRKQIGSNKIEKALLELLPAGATSSYSFGRDLTKAESEALRVSNKGQFPNRRRKAVRDAEAKQSGPSDLPGASNSPISPSATGASDSPAVAAPSVVNTSIAAAAIAPSSRGQKRRHAAADLDVEPDSSNPRAPKTRRVHGTFGSAKSNSPDPAPVVKKRRFDDLSDAYPDFDSNNSDPKRQKLTSTYGDENNYIYSPYQDGPTAFDLGGNTLSTYEPPFNPSNLEYQLETADHQDRGDFRYINPITDEDITTVFNKVQLTRMDYIQKLGPGYDPGYDDMGECYMAQVLRLQDKFNRLWRGPGLAPLLYGCYSEEWSNGFASWLVMDDEGLGLLESIYANEVWDW